MNYFTFAPASVLWGFAVGKKEKINKVLAY